MEQKLILLADDDSDDVEMFCEALARIDSTIVCQSVVNGKELLKKLDVMDTKPQLIFLDLNMPIINGWECLKKLKEDERYSGIPVIMISTSSHKREMDKAAQQGALCYFVKPSNFNELVDVLQVIVPNLGMGLKKAIKDLHTVGSKHVFACQ